MGVYSYKRTKISKKTGKRVTKTYYYYNGRYRDANTGQLKSYKKRGFETQKEAMSAERQFLLSIKDECKTDMTFAALAEDYILFAENRRKVSSIMTTEGHLKNHLLPAFGNYSIFKLEPRHIVKFQNEKIKAGFSISYINTLTNSIKKILFYAVKYYRLEKNPASMIEPLRENESVDPDEEKMICWDLSMYNKVMEVADDPFYKNLISFLYFTGLRKGEAAALNWNDIDLKNKKVKVTKTITTKLRKSEREQNMSWRITTPKTKTSIRTISINDSLVEMLEEMKKEAMYYDGWSNKSFIFGLYKPFSYTTFDRRLKKWAKDANVPLISPHGLRHSHISLLINNGINILAVAKRAGDTVEMILKTYAHLFKENEEAIISLLNELI